MLNSIRNRCRIPAILLCLVFVHGSLRAGVDKMGVRYLGGSFSDVKPGKEGRFEYGEDGITFLWKGSPPHTLRYDSITTIEYGQKVGRRIGATIALGATTLGLLALPMLLSKKRKHFATIGFKDQNGQAQALILEFGKRANKAALSTMALRSGVEIQFENEQAQKEFRH